MSNNLETVGKALSLVQLAQMLVSLTTAIKSAIENGRDSVTEDELAASVASNDAALEALSAAIARAKAEGR